MNQIELLLKHIQSEFPGVQASLDPPLVSSGEWFLDINHNGHTVIVQWRPTVGFGISAPHQPPLLGEGPDEAVADLHSAASRVKELLLWRHHTTTAGPQQ